MSLTLQLSESHQGRSDPPPSERWASEGSGPKDWEAQRPYIEQLYKDKTLKEIVELMKAERNFKATPRMYKARIKQWGLRKYQISNATKTIAPKDGPRKSTQENSALEKNNKTINGRKIQRSGKGSIIQNIAKDKLDEAIQDSSSSVVRFIGNPSTMKSPQQLRPLELILDNIDAYIRGSFENGTWQRGKRTQLCRSVKERTEQSYFGLFQYSVWTAFSLFRAGDLRGTERSWATVSALITDVVRSEGIRIWDGLCNLVVDLHSEGWLEVGREISRQCSRVAAILYGDHHPLHLLFDALAKIPPSELNHTAATCWQRAGDVFENILGPSHITVIAERCRSMRMLPNATNTQSKIDGFKKLIKQCEDSWSSLDTRTVLVRHDYASLLHKCGLDAEAIQEAELILDHLQLRQPNQVSSPIHPSAGHGVNSPSTNGSTALQGSESTIEERKRSVTLSFTWTNTRGTGAILKLEEHLKRAEMLMAAKQARERSLSVHEVQVRELNEAASAKSWP